jgi:outer membrane protein OmpA-like peptidoglycan-associated protein
MYKQRRHHIRAIAVSITLALAMSGCATRRYARNQVAPVNERVTTLETQTNGKFAATDEKIAAVSAKEQSDISQVNERITTTDLKLAQVTGTVDQAQAAAARLAQESEANAAKIANSSAASAAAIKALALGVANSLNFQLVEKADVTFGFNDTELTPEAKAALDQVASKVQAMPRAVVELIGFTDPTGSKDYNVALSLKRAEAVQRYLVRQKVGLRSIHVVGLGEEAPPPDLQADVRAVDSNPSKAEINRLARRVHIRVYGAGEASAATGGGQQ